MTTKPVLSIIITAHHEGLLAHKTMLSVFRALEEAKKAGYTYEIIIHIDKGDPTTNTYFSRYENRKDIKIIHGNFGDTGPSRNRAVQESTGRYVAFLDADDLISKNWYLEGIKLLESNDDKTIVCPAAILTFGNNEQNILTLQPSSISKEIDTIIMIGENCWSSVIMANRELLLDIPYQTLSKGYAHEDYLFNCMALQKNVHFIIAKDTVLFYRRSANSRLSSSNNEHGTIPYTPLFDFDNVKCLETESVEIKDLKARLRENGRKVYKKIRGNNTLNYFITPIAKATKKILNQQTPTKVPQFVINAWIEANAVDSQLYPHKHLVDQVSTFSADYHLNTGKAFCKLAQNIHHRPDYIFVVPWIVRGGADKVLFNYIKAMQEIDPARKITIITTLPAKNLWAKQLPDCVDFIDFGNVANGLTPYDQDTLFTRLIIQLQCKNLHIINSEYAYQWIYNHRTLISAQHYVVNVSYFCYEYIQESHLQAIHSYDNPCLFNIYPIVNRIFTDNATIIQDSVNRNAFDEDKFTVHYQPVFDEVKSYREHKIIKPVHILWASRVVNVKLPQVLAEIGAKLNPDEYAIDVYGEIGSEIPKNIFENSSAIKYHGAFDGFHALPIEQSDIFLYTSMNDGVPNIILEAIAAGLPIVASNDGGVNEIIRDHETGFLIDNPLDADAYISAIKEAIKNPSALPTYVASAQKLLQSRHSWSKFVKNVKKDLG